MLKLRILIFLLSFSYLAFAEDTARIKIDILGLSSGYGTNIFLDPYASSKIYSANNVPFNFLWLTELNRSYEKLKIGIFSSSYSSSNRLVNLTDFNGFQANLDYIYFFKIQQKKNSMFYLGPGINFLYSYDSYRFHFFEDVYYNTVEILSSLDANAATRIKLKKDWILLNVGFSLVAYTGFLKYSLGSPYKGSLKLFPRYKSFLMEADYYFQVSRAVFLNLGYRFYYYNYPKYGQTDLMKRANSQLTIGINLKL